MKEFSRTVTNKRESYLFFQVSLFISIAFVCFIFLAYSYILSELKNKKNEYVITTSKILASVIMPDLSIIFNEDTDIKHFTIIKNYKLIKDNTITEGVFGSSIHTKRGDRVLIADLQPMVLFVNRYLDKDFDYQIYINNKLILGNTNNQILYQALKYPIDQKNYIQLSLNGHNDIEKFNHYYKEFLFKICYIVAASIILFLFSLRIAFVVTKYVNNYMQLAKTQILAVQAYKYESSFLKICSEQSKNKEFYGELSINKDACSAVTLQELLEEIEIRAIKYSREYGYDLSLSLSVEKLSMEVGCELHIFQQIVLSLLYNILYFMRGGSHVKKLSIEFTLESIYFTYDGFWLDEEAMEKCSSSIHLHISNPYILNTKCIFALLRDCNFFYEIGSNDGENRILINFNNFNKLSDQNGKIIQFKKY